MDELFTVNEVQKILKMSRIGVIKWIKQGKLPARKLNNSRRWYIKKSDIEEIINGK